MTGRKTEHLIIAAVVVIGAIFTGNHFLSLKERGTTVKPPIESLHIEMVTVEQPKEDPPMSPAEKKKASIRERLKEARRLALLGESKYDTDLIFIGWDAEEIGFDLEIKEEVKEIKKIGASFMIIKHLNKAIRTKDNFLRGANLVLARLYARDIDPDLDLSPLTDAIEKSKENETENDVEEQGEALKNNLETESLT